MDKMVKEANENIQLCTKAVTTRTNGISRRNYQALGSGLAPDLLSRLVNSFLVQFCLEAI